MNDIIINLTERCRLRISMGVNVVIGIEDLIRLQYYNKWEHRHSTNFEFDVNTELPAFFKAISRLEKLLPLR